MTLCDFVKILVSVCPNTYHDHAHKESDEYMVWSITGQKSLRSDGIKNNTIEIYTVDIYTKQEFSNIPHNLEKKLDMYDEIAYSDPASNYDFEKGYTHYVYMIEVI